VNGHRPEEAKNLVVPKRKRKDQNEELNVGGGKVEIQNQDSHFPTAPTACGARMNTAVYTKRLTHPARSVFSRPINFMMTPHKIN
jgi:hypothetical protein